MIPAPLVAHLPPEPVDGWAEWRLDHLGPWLATRLLHTVVYLLCAFLLAKAWSVLMRRAAGAVKGREGLPAEEEKRLETLLAVVRRTGALLVYLAVGLVVLSDFGLQIGPLLAGFGVAGVAFGFGAQYLVKDLITGFFLLFERQIAVDDVVKINEFQGTVEYMSLRTTRLRSAGGELHTIPNGEVRCVTNYTRRWARAVVDAEVPYRARLDDAFAALTEAGRRAAGDSEVGPLLLEPPEVLGVTALGENAVTVRLWVKTRAGEQWRVERFLRRAVKESLEERGLDVPFPQRTLSADPALAELLRGKHP